MSYIPVTQGSEINLLNPWSYSLSLNCRLLRTVLSHVPLVLGACLVLTPGFMAFLSIILFILRFLTIIALLGSLLSLEIGTHEVGLGLRHLTIERLRITVKRHLLLHHVGRNLTVVLVVLVEGHWLGSQILVGVKSTQSNKVGKIINLDHGHWSLHLRVVVWVKWLAHLVVIITLISALEIAICLLLLIVFEFFWHWWKSYSFG